MTAEINIDWKVTRVFTRNYNSPKRIVVNRGGTRSSKTYSLCQLAVHWLFTGEYRPDEYIDTGVWSIVRKTLPALKATAYRDVIDILHAHDLYQYVMENKTERTIAFGDRMIEFFSADDQQKVRSRKRAILHIAESNELSYHDFQQLAFRTTDRIYLDFNPDDVQVWINTKIEQERAAVKDDVEVIVSTYLDNRFLDTETVSEIEYLKKTDPELWAVFGQGEYGKISGLIYPHYEVIPAMPEDRIKHDIYGLDFGFSNPMALVRCGVYDDELYIDEIFYKQGKTVPEMCEALDIDKRSKIYADSADPGRIQEMVNQGYSLTVPAYKGQNSVGYGINQVKNYRMFVTSRSVNVLRELRSYKWDTDRAGDSTEKPVKAFDHGLDAVRYAIATHFHLPRGKARATVPKARFKIRELK